MCVSGSDDGNVLIHDIRAKEPAIKFANTRGYQVTAVTFNDAADRVSIYFVQENCFHISRLSLVFRSLAGVSTAF